MKRNLMQIIVVFLSGLAMTSCTSLMGQGVAKSIVDSEKALQSYPDPKTLELAMPGNLLMMENFARTFSDNPDIQIAVTKAYTGYAQGFVEDKDPERARKLLMRGKQFGWKALMLNDCFKNRYEANTQNPDWNALFQCFDRKEDVPYLFWTGSAWGGWLNLSRQDPDAAAEVMFDVLPVRKLMERAWELNPDFYYGAPTLFFAVLYTQMPASAGGGPKKAKEAFEKVIQLSEGKFLMPKVLYARYYLVALKERERYREVLSDVLNTPDDILPEARLANMMAKRKAKIYLERMDKIF